MQPPVFVKINTYKELTTMLQKIQDRLLAADKTIAELDKLKEQEDIRIMEWKENLDAIRDKLDSVEDTIHQR